MSPLMRWRLAIPLALFSALFLGGTVLGAWAYWDRWSLGERLITVFLGIVFALNLGISISIGADRRVTETPWSRIGTIALFFVLACGVTVVRRNL
jgi:hypothetical protein